MTLTITLKTLKTFFHLKFSIGVLFPTSLNLILFLYDIPKSFVI